MNESEQLSAVSLFAAVIEIALAEKCKAGSPVPLNQHAFAAVALEMREQNAFARLFPVFNTGGGPFCQDFHEGVTLVQTAGQLHRIYDPANHFRVCMTPDKVASHATREHFADALDFARRYLETATTSI